MTDTPAPSVASRAEAIAREAHAGQVEKYGRKRPYIEHVAAVVAGVKSDDERAVAWLHDVFEDTEWMPADFDRHGIPLHITDAVVLLSRNKAIPYEDYIAELADSGDRLAIVVKLADLRDHLHPTCPDTLRPRYEAALAVLQKALADLCSSCPVFAALQQQLARLTALVEQWRVLARQSADARNTHSVAADAFLIEVEGRLQQCADELELILTAAREEP